MATGSKPSGTITRGTTHPNRLRRFDRWIVHRAGQALRSASTPLVVDLGFGSAPTTTLELSHRLRAQVRPDLIVIGSELDPARVAAAHPFASELVTFQRGGFEIATPARPVVIRAANVLRQYPLAEVVAAWAQMSSRLAPGGVLIEGTCDELGRLASWVTLAAGSASPDTWTMSVALAHLARPGEVAARLPKALIHHNIPGQRVHDVLATLDQAWERARPYGVFGARQRWLATVADLRSAGLPVLPGPARWRLGELTLPWSAVS